MTFPRASGILLHPTSLTGKHGIGEFGYEAYCFADFLAASGQTLWQVLPLGPTDDCGSPYAGHSAFAGNTLLISPDRLVEDGLISKNDLSSLPSLPEGRVDFGAARSIKDSVLAKASANYRSTMELRREFETFADENASWLDDYALFRALKTAHHGKPWYEWEPSLAQRKSAALKSARKELHEQIEEQKVSQFIFFRQWLDLKGYCNRRGIKIVGDIPFFVAHDSADVWTGPEQFKLNADGSPIVVAGVPPDYFSETGQYWGNPLFDWERMRADGFKWWIARLRATLQLVDIARLDHFRGFSACWEIPGGDKTAERGCWVETPGRELFTAVRDELGELPIVAEDLGVITPDVENLRDDFGFPGMRILQFGFSSDSDNVHLPHNYSQNLFVYTGTHDNDTTVGWFNSVASDGSTHTAEQIESERNFCLEHLQTDGKEIHWDFIRAVLESVANTAIVPLQDVLGLGTEARMNLPNSSSGNWLWRLRENVLSDKLSARLRDLSTRSGRAAENEEPGNATRRTCGVPGYFNVR